MEKTQNSISHKIPSARQSPKRIRGFKFGYIFLALAFISSTFVSFTLPASPAQAAYVDLDARERARSYGYYRALDYCVTKMNIGIAASSDYDGMRTDPMNGYWFAQGGDDPSGGNAVDVVPYKTGSEGGRTGCADAVRTALNNYWNISYTDFLKGIGYSWNASKSQWIYSNKNGSRPDQLKTLLASRSVSTDWTDAVAYNIYYIAFSSACSASDVTDSDTNKTLANNRTSKGGVTYTWVYNLSVDGTTKTVYTYKPVTSTTNYGQGAKSTDEDTITLYQGNQKKCSEVASLLGNQRYANAAYDALLTDKCKAAGVGSADGQRSACIDGAKNKTDPNYCKKYLANTSYFDACRKGQGVTIAAGDLPSDKVGSGDGDGEDTTSCAIEGVGWIVCPIAGFIGGLNDGLWAILHGFLEIQPRMFNPEGDTYRIWSSVRNIGNVAFIIVFLIIVYSQLTGMGVSNYGVKKMLPRLIVAAVLVNVSFYVCAIFVDISNIVGNGVYTVLSDLQGSTSTNTGIGAPVTSWKDAIGWVLAGGVGAWAINGVAVSLGTYGLWGALALLVPAALAALFAFIMVVVLLLARQAFVIILTVIAPLAFVAYLLPNTTQWFDRWRKFFTTMLILFPTVALLFGGSELAAGVIRSANPGDGLLVIGSLAIAALPLFALPALMKTAGGLMNRIAGMVNNPNRGPFDKMKKRAEGFAKDRSGQRSIRAFNGDKMFGGRRFRRDARRDAEKAGIEREAGRARTSYIASELATDPQTGELANKANQKFANRVAGGTLGSPADSAAITRALANAQITLDKVEAEEVSAEKVLIEKMPRESIRGVINTAPVGGAQHIAAMQRAVETNDLETINKMWENPDIRGNQTARTALADALARSSSRPAYLGQGALDDMRRGAKLDSSGNPTQPISSIEQSIEGAIQAGAYSPKKISLADQDELEIVRTTNISGASKHRLQQDTRTALSDPILGKEMAKNRAVAGKIAGGIWTP